jgi:hypothetical protein
MTYFMILGVEPLLGSDLREDHLAVAGLGFLGRNHAFAEALDRGAPSALATR